jgi:uracil-DNA glycosylase family 4
MDDRALKELELLAVTRLYRAADVAPVAARNLDVTPGAARNSDVTPGAAIAAMDGGPMPAATASWDELRSLVAACRACGLCQQRKQAVFGVGAETGPWLFVGEGPGADEDEQGEPFVGQAGRLLDNMLAAIGCRRGHDTYIANVVKCRPPGNRTPTAEEAAACAPFLDRQIELVAPKLIVALGKSAIVRLLATEASVASLRGKVHRYRGIPVVVTYHPAYLLRSLPEKAKAWEDLLLARRTLAAAT